MQTHVPPGTCPIRVLFVFEKTSIAARDQAQPRRVERPVRAAAVSHGERCGASKPRPLWRGSAEAENVRLAAARLRRGERGSGRSGHASSAAGLASLAPFRPDGLHLLLELREGDGVVAVGVVLEEFVGLLLELVLAKAAEENLHALVHVDGARRVLVMHHELDDVEQLARFQASLRNAAENPRPQRGGQACDRGAKTRTRSLRSRLPLATAAPAVG